MPVVTLLLAFTNEQHYFYWSSITEVPTRDAACASIYRGGPWYWVHAGYSYFLDPDRHR